MELMPRNSLMGRLQQRGMLASALESPRGKVIAKEQSCTTARAAGGSSERNSASCEKTPVHLRSSPRLDSADKESSVGGYKSEQQVGNAKPAKKSQRTASSEKGGPVTPRKGSGKVQQPIGTGMSPGSSERGPPQGSPPAVQRSKSGQPAVSDGQMQHPASSSGEGMASGGNKMKQREGSALVPKDLMSRPSIGQWLRASLSALLRIPSSECATPSKRKVGKQRPSCIPPECLPRPVRKSLATYKPRRRKMGKQRPSILFPLGNILKDIPNSASQTKLADKTDLLSDTCSDQGVASLSSSQGATLLKGSSACTESPHVENVKRTSREKLVEQTGLLASAGSTQGRIRVDALNGASSNAGGSDIQNRCGNEKLLDQAGLLIRSRAGPLHGDSDIQTVKRTSSNSKKPILKRVSLKAAKREEDNYDISDLEEDSYGHRIEPDRIAKRLPAWCSDWVDLATAQGEINPDSIFGSQVPKCDLDVIFPDHFYAGFKAVKRKRGSSCNWVKDALTKREIVAYASKMGQNKRWSSIPKKSLRASARRKAATGSAVLCLGKETANAAQVPKVIVQALITPMQASSDKQ